MQLPSLHYHPLSSCCHKVLIAAEELGVALDLRLLNLGDPAERAAFLGLWPLGKMPLLVDDGQVLPETSIIIEHLQQRHAGSGRRLIPEDNEAALQVRLWDRLLDLYLMTPMQACTADLLRAPEHRDALGASKARESLRAAYALLDTQLAGRAWLCGDAFSLADCAAAPALFYAISYVPLEAAQARLSAYFERLIERPSVRQCIDAARPFFQYYPGRAGLQPRFYTPASS